MAKELLPEELWKLIEPELPQHLTPGPRGGRPRVSDKLALRGILFVLKTGIQWTELPTEVFQVSGVTCWRRLHQWSADGVWDRVHRVLLEELDYAGRIDWQRALLDADSMPAKKKGLRRARTQPIAARPAPSVMS